MKSSVNIYSFEMLERMITWRMSNRLHSFDVLRQDEVRRSITEVLQDLDDWSKMNILFSGVMNQVYWRQVFSLPFTVLGFNYPTDNSNEYPSYWLMISELLEYYFDDRNIAYINLEIDLSKEGRAIFIIDKTYYHSVASREKFEAWTARIDRNKNLYLDWVYEAGTTRTTRLFKELDDIFLL